MRGLNLTRLVVAALVAGVSGCTSCGPAEDCDNVLITFDAPNDGDTVNAPLDVSVTVTDRGGNPLELGSATVATRLSSATEFSVPTPGAISSGKATFGAVPMQAGPNLVRVSVQKANSQCSPLSKTIAVTVQDTATPPEVTAFVIDADTDNNGMLNSAELPANPAALNVTITTARAIGCNLAVKYMGGDVATRSIDAATVQVSIPATGLAGLVDAAVYTLLADVSCPDGRRNDPVTNTLATKTFGIDRLAPSCDLLSPSRTIFGPSDDDDPAATGFQIRTLGQAGNGAALMEIRLTATGSAPQTTGQQSAAGGTLARDFTIPATGDTNYSVILEVVDSAGNLCTVARQVQADFVAPQFTVTEPTAGTKTSYNLPVTLAVTGDNGAAVTVTTTPSGGSAQAVCGGTVANGAFTCNGSFPSGTQTVSVTVTDLAGNSTTQTVNITVNAPGCAIAFTIPNSNPALLTPRNDLQPGVPDLQYQFTAVSSTAGCGNKVVRLLRNGVLVETSSTDATGNYRSSTRTEPDSAGVTITYRAEIDDGVGNTTYATVGVVVNLNIPVITAPSSGTNLNTERDLDHSTAGVQYPLSYSPAPPSGFKGVLCSSVQFGGGAVCPDNAGGFIVPGGDGVPVSSAAFTFPDGTYTIRLVFKEIAGPQTVSDPAATSSIAVESVRPTVTSFTFQGDANGDRRLNIAEQGSGNPVAVFAIANGNGGTVVVRDRTTNTVVSAAPAAIASGAAMVALPGLGASAANFEGDFSDLVAEVTTALGSKNMILTPPPTGTTLNAAAFASLRVDRVAPSCTMTAPNTAQLGIADDADGVASGYQVRVAGSTQVDVGTNGVLLELIPSGGAAQTQTVTPASGVGAHNFTVPGTGETDYEARCTATDLSGNAGTRVTRAVRVDLVAPGCTLVTPNAGASPYTSSYAIATQVTVTDGNGLVPAIFSRVGAGSEQQIGQLPAVSGGTSTGNVTYPSGAQTVRVQVTDAAGNSCNGASAQQAITVNVPGCSLVWSGPNSNPARLLRSQDTAPGSTTTMEYTLTGTSGCTNQQIRFYRGSVAPANELPGSPSTTNGSGGFSFPISLPDSDGATAETIIAEMNNGNLTSFPLTLYVDMTLPVVSSVSPTGANVYFVSPSNSQLALSNYVPDTNTGVAGAQFTVSVNVTGAVGGELSVRYQGSQIAGPVTIGATNPVTLDVTLPHNTVGSLVTRVTDASGNIVDATSNAAVDVIAPGPTTVTCTLVPGKAREARVSAAWSGSGTYDDATDSSSGAVAKFDVRWTSELVAPGGLANSAAYFDSNLAWQDAAVDPPATSREVLVPPLVSTYCYVRARDELYNYSPFPSTLPAAVANAGSRLSLSNPHPAAAAAQAFGKVMAANGSLNNDGIADLAVGYGQSGSASDPERVYLYYGASTGFATQTPQAITAPDSVVGAFGFDVSMGNAGDATAGDNKADLLVAAPRANTSAGRAYLFFGSTSQGQLSTAAGNYVVFAGNAASQFGRSAQIVGDINGDGVGEVVIAAPTEDSGRGRVYLYYGRSVAAWTTLAGGSPIPASAADRVFLGPSPLQPPTNDFGRLRGGITTVGADLAIPDSKTSVAALFIFSGATINAGDAGTPFTTGQAPAIANEAMQTLQGTTGGAGQRESFGTRVITNVSMVGNSGVDMMVTEPFYKYVHFYADRQSGLFPATPALTVTMPASTLVPGVDAQCFDFSGDGRPDVFLGDQSSTSATYYLHNRGLAGDEFERTPGTPGSFWYARLTGARMGVGMASGDFNSDTIPDVAIADDSDGTGKVFVWY